jgi:hypothetical protein
MKTLATQVTQAPVTWRLSAWKMRSGSGQGRRLIAVVGGGGRALYTDPRTAVGVPQCGSHVASALHVHA